MNFLAFDTSTDRLSVAVQRGAQQWQHEGSGGPQASSTLIATVLDLLAQAGLSLSQLDALAFGRGPGSFTGLRTACAVAQGLAFGAKLPVLPIDSLLAVAESCRLAHASPRVLAVLDARMNQLYAAAWAWSESAGWQQHGDTVVCDPEALQLPPGDAPLESNPAAWVLAGNAFEPYGARLPAALRALPQHPARPTAQALLSLAPAWLAAGRAVPAAQALPLYIRDKVALTTAERAAQAAARA